MASKFLCTLFLVLAVLAMAYAQSFSPPSTPTRSPPSTPTRSPPSGTLAPPFATLAPPSGTRAPSSGSGSYSGGRIADLVKIATDGVKGLEQSTNTEAELSKYSERVQKNEQTIISKTQDLLKQIKSNATAVAERVRNTIVNIGNNNLEIKSGSVKLGNAFQVLLKNEKNFQLAFKTFGNKDATGSESTRFRVRFGRIIQFVDTNTAIAGFDDKDTICKSVAITGDTASVTDLGTSVVDGVNVRSILGSTLNGAFTIKLKFAVPNASNTTSTGVFTDNGRTIDVTTVKFDLAINGTTFGYNSTCYNADAAKSKLALIAWARTSETDVTAAAADGTTTDDDSSSSVVRTTVRFGAAAGTFTWSGNANMTVGGKVYAAPVVTSPLNRTAVDSDASKNGESGSDANDFSARAAWTFDYYKPDSISWDPELSSSASINPATGLVQSSNPSTAQSPASSNVVTSANTVVSGVVAVLVTGLLL